VAKTAKEREENWGPRAARVCWNPGEYQGEYKDVNLEISLKGEQIDKFLNIFSPRIYHLLTIFVLIMANVRTLVGEFR